MAVLSAHSSNDDPLWFSPSEVLGIALRVIVGIAHALAASVG